MAFTPESALTMFGAEPAELARYESPFPVYPSGCSVQVRGRLGVDLSGHSFVGKAGCTMVFRYEKVRFRTHWPLQWLGSTEVFIWPKQLELRLQPEPDNGQHVDETDTGYTEITHQSTEFDIDQVQGAYGLVFDRVAQPASLQLYDLLGGESELPEFVTHAITVMRQTPPSKPPRL